MLSKWQFVQASIGEWRWQLVGAAGTVEKQSIPGFTSKVECLKDAKANGYPMDSYPEYFESIQMLSRS